MESMLVEEDDNRARRRVQSLYPPGFPTEGQRWVRAAIERSKQWFAQQRDAAFTSKQRKKGKKRKKSNVLLVSSSVRPDKHLFDARVLRYRCVMRAFRVFAREARRLRPWEAEEMKKYGLDFLLRLAMEIESEERYDNYGQELGSLLNEAGDDLRPAVWDFFRRSPEWRYFQMQVLRVAQTPRPKRAAPLLSLAETAPAAPGQPPRGIALAPPADVSSRGGVTRKKKRSKRAPSKKIKSQGVPQSLFTSEFDQAVATVLRKNLVASALDVYCYFDTHLKITLPDNFKTKLAQERHWVPAYHYSPQQRHALNQRVTRVRKKLEALKTTGR